MKSLLNGGTYIKKKRNPYTNLCILFLSFVILLHVLTPIANAEDSEQTYQEKEELPDGLIPYSPFPKDGEFNNFITYLLQNPSDVISYTRKNTILSLGYYLAFYKQTFSLGAIDFGTDTPTIEIGYNETVSFNIGKVNLEEYKTSNFDNISLQPFIKARSFSFIVDQFPGNRTDSWLIDFTPDIVIINEDNTKANYNVSVTLTLTSPPIGDKAIQSGILRIKQSPVQSYGSFWDMPFPLNLIYTLQFGQTSGVTSKPDYENMRDVEILVKVKPYHNVKIETPEVTTINPNQVKPLRIGIENLGNYKDTIGFKIANKGSGITLIDPVDITLKPGEIKDTILGIAAEPNLIDYGTLHRIRIQAYSLDDPSNIISEKLIILKTEGIYISPVTLGSVVFSVIVVLFVIFILVNIYKITSKKVFKNLKEKLKFTKEKRKVKKPKKKKEKLKESPKDKSKKESKEKTEKKPKETEKKKEEKIEKKKQNLKAKTDKSEINKKRILKKIKREQEKARKKLGGKK